jgi:hypothetical protein
MYGFILTAGKDSKLWTIIIAGQNVLCTCKRVVNIALVLRMINVAHIPVPIPEIHVNKIY